MKTAKMKLRILTILLLSIAIIPGVSASIYDADFEDSDYSDWYWYDNYDSDVESTISINSTNPINGSKSLWMNFNDGNGQEVRLFNFSSYNTNITINFQYHNYRDDADDEAYIYVPDDGTDFYVNSHFIRGDDTGNWLYYDGSYHDLGIAYTNNTQYNFSITIHSFGSDSQADYRINGVSCSNNSGSRGTVDAVHGLGFGGNQGVKHMLDEICICPGEYNYTCCSSGGAPADSKAPIVTIESADDRTTSSSTPEITIKAIDETDSNPTCYLYFNETLKSTDTISNNTATNVTPSSLNTGRYDYYVNCTDGTNTNSSSTYNITIQNSPPHKPILIYPSNDSHGIFTRPNLNVTPTDPNGGTLNVSYYNNATGANICNATGVSNGSIASCQWKTLNETTKYCFYANVTDGEKTNQSDTWCFTTFPTIATNYTTTKINNFSVAYASYYGGNLPCGDIDNDGSTECYAASSVTDTEQMLLELNGSSYNWSGYASTAAYSTIIQDMTGDGKIDLVHGFAESGQSAQLNFYTINRSYGFETSNERRSIEDSSNHPHGFGLVNLTGGDLRIATSYCGGGEVRLIETNSSGTTTQLLKTHSNSGEATDACDIDGDGDTEIISVNGWAGGQAKINIIEINQSTGAYISDDYVLSSSLAGSTFYTAGVKCGDLDNSGKVGLVVMWVKSVTNHGNNNTVLEYYEFNTSYGTGYEKGFKINDGPPFQHGVYANLESGFINDITGDGKNELVMGMNSRFYSAEMPVGTNNQSSIIMIEVGENGTTTTNLTTLINFTNAFGDYGYHISNNHVVVSRAGYVGDSDGDGKTEFVVSHSYEDHWGTGTGESIFYLMEYDTATSNTAPNQPTVNNPSNQSTGEDLSVDLNVTVTDPDGDTMNVTFYNQTSGTIIGAKQTSISNGSTAQVTFSSLSPGTRYDWYVNITDGTSTTQSTTFYFITSHTPTVNNVDTYGTTNGDTPRTDEDLEFNITCTDSDGGETITAYIEIFNGTNSFKNHSTAVTNNTLTTIWTVGQGNTSKSEVWNATYWCGDSISNTSKTSDSVSIQNSIPSNPTSLSVNSSVDEGENITATATGSTDADGDIITYHYKFYNINDTTEVQAYSSNNIYNTQSTDADDIINITVKATTIDANSTGTISNTTDVNGTGDTTPPMITLHTDINWTSDNTPSFNFTPVDETAATLNCTLWINGSMYGNNNSITNNTIAWITTNTSLSDNTGYSATINCSDGTNNNVSSADTFNIDTTSPSPRIEVFNQTIEADNTETTTINFSASDTGIGLDTCNYNVTYPNGSNEVYSGGAVLPTTLSLATNIVGRHNLTLWCNDSLGHNATNTSYYYANDTIAPTITLLNTSYNTSQTKPGIWFKINEATNNAKCTLYINNTARNQTTGVTNNTVTQINSNTTLNETTYLFWVNCTDDSNNTGESSNISIRIDITNPIIPYLSPVAGYTSNSGTITYTWNVTEDYPDSCVIRFDGSNIHTESITSTGQYTSSYGHSISSGTYPWNITCNDTVSNSYTSPTRFITFDVSASPSGGGSGGGGTSSYYFKSQTSQKSVNLGEEVNVESEIDNKQSVTLKGEVVSWIDDNKNNELDSDEDQCSVYAEIRSNDKWSGYCDMRIEKTTPGDKILLSKFTPQSYYELSPGEDEDSILIETDNVITGSVVDEEGWLGIPIKYWILILGVLVLFFIFILLFFIFLPKKGGFGGGGDANTAERGEILSSFG